MPPILVFLFLYSSYSNLVWSEFCCQLVSGLYTFFGFVHFAVHILFAFPMASFIAKHKFTALDLGKAKSAITISSYIHIYYCIVCDDTVRLFRFGCLLLRVARLLSNASHFCVLVSFASINIASFCL